MATVQFVVEGGPVGKEAPGLNKRTRELYTRPKTKEYEARVRNAAVMAMVEADLAPLAGPVEVECQLFCAIPKSWPQWKKDLCHDESIWYPETIDLDNSEKALLDGMKTVAFPDDRQVVRLSATKVYSPRPRVEIFVGQLNRGVLPAKKPVEEPKPDSAGKPKR